MSSLDPNKAMGIDKISPKVLKYCATSLCEPITYLYSQCLHFGYLPLEWQTHLYHSYLQEWGQIHGIKLPSNIFTMYCIKSTQEIIYRHTNKFFSDLFTNHQFGFIPGRSSLQQLLLFVNDIIQGRI